MPFNKKFGINSLVSASGRLLTGFITLLIMPLYLPLLGNEAFGLFGVFASFELIFLILEGGLGNILVKDFAQEEAEGKSVTKKLRSFEALYLLFGIFQTCLCVIAVKLNFFSFLNIQEMNQNTVNNCLLVISMKPLVSSVTIIHDALITARNQLITLNILRLKFSILASVGSYFVLLITDGNSLAFFGWWIIITLFSGVIRMAVCWQGNFGSLLKTPPKIITLKPYLKDQLKLIALSMLTFFSTQYSIWILGYLAPLATVGLFTLSQKVSQTLGSSLAALTRPMLSFYAQIKVKKSSDIASQVVLRMSEIIIIIGLLSLVSYHFISHSIIEIWLNKSSKAFETSVVSKVSFYLLAFTVIEMISRPFMDTLLAERKLSLVYMKQILMIIIGIPLSVLLYKSNNVTGLAQAYFLTSLINFIFIPLFVKKMEIQNGVRLYILTFLSMLLASLMLATILYFINLRILAPHNILAACLALLFFLGISLFLFIKKVIPSSDEKNCIY